MALAQSVQGPPDAVNFNKVNVCPAGQSSPKPCTRMSKLTYNVTATTTFGATNVVTQGVPNLDFTLRATTCTGTLPAGSSCTVTVKFAPLAPGVRMGAVQLTDASGNLLATTYIYGNGQGPVAAFSPGPQITLPITGLTTQYAVAVDAAGEVFFPVDDGIAKFNPRTGIQTAVAVGTPRVFGLAVDGVGDIFASELGTNVVIEIAPGTGTQTTVGIGLSSPVGVAADGRGNVFIANNGNSGVARVHSADGLQTTVLPRNLGGQQFLYYPTGVAVDGIGDVFVTDQDNSQVWEVPAGGLHGGFPIPVAQADIPTGVAVDAAGDLFVADFGFGQIGEIPADGSAEIFVGGEISAPWGLAVDGLGNLFLGDSTASGATLLEVNGAQPPSLNFGIVAVGSTSVPQSVTIQNVGNQPLNAIAPGLIVGKNFLQVAGSGTPADCNSSFSLASGATCNLSIVFAPQVVGTIHGTATFTDNALNTVPSANQMVPLQGTGTQ
jgi:streptogramin lyase